jgi:SAM-dependent methyltransferase
MHQSSFDKMTAFREKYLENAQNEKLEIIDLGSQDVNGSYRSIFNVSSWSYRGVDMAPGKNVDIALKDPYSWREIRSNSVDVLVSGQAFEHIEFFWLTMFEICRVLKPNGLCCIIAPSAGPEHRYPVDCWRFYPDGLAAIVKYVGMQVLEVSTQWAKNPIYQDSSNDWKDSMLVCQKRKKAYLNEFKLKICRFLLRTGHPVKR